MNGEVGKMTSTTMQHTEVTKSGLRLPGEILNKIYIHAMLSHLPESRERLYRKINSDCEVSKMRLDCRKEEETSETRYLDHGILKLPKLVNGVVSQTISHILFSVKTFNGLHRLVGELQVLRVSAAPMPECNIEVSLLGEFVDRPGFAMEHRRARPHGRDCFVFEHIAQMMRLLRQLLPNVNIFLFFDCFWLDYRALWKACLLHDMDGRIAACRFGKRCRIHSNYEFHVQQTLAAVACICYTNQIDLTDLDFRNLYKCGCWGFIGKIESGGKDHVLKRAPMVEETWK